MYVLEILSTTCVSFSDREIDLDIPEYETSLKNYSATLGHKACHSFDAKNAKFEQLYHPR